jgi:hypothetical protein
VPGPAPSPLLSYSSHLVLSEETESQKHQAACSSPTETGLGLESSVLDVPAGTLMHCWAPMVDTSQPDSSLPSFLAPAPATHPPPPTASAANVPKHFLGFTFALAVPFVWSALPPWSVLLSTVSSALCAILSSPVPWLTARVLEWTREGLGSHSL